LLSLHEHNESERGKLLLNHLKQGHSLALISDAGTPLINDPGYSLVKHAHSAGITVIPIPGACAAITALCAAGLPTDKFIFEGFLPTKSLARQNRLNELKDEVRTLLFYEAPHRLLATIADMLQIFGVNRQVVLARELTKKFETIHGATLADLQKWLTANPKQQKGEMVLLVHGAVKTKKAQLSAETLRVLHVLLAELPVNPAVGLAAKITGCNKNQLYKTALQMK